MVQNGYLNDADLLFLRQVNPVYNVMGHTVPILKHANIKPLRQTRSDYAEQKEIDFNCVILLTACVIQLGMDFGCVLRFLGGEYTGEYRGIALLKEEVTPNVDPDDWAQMVRILTKGCPAQLRYKFPREYKHKVLCRGNASSILDNKKEVTATMNK